MDAVGFLKLGVRLAGGLCGVPGVSVLADVIVVLIETCDNIPRQRQVPPIRLLSTRAHSLSRQNVLDLQKRCVSLLEFLDAESSNGLPTSKGLEKGINETSE
jgi:hypothetical protein